MGMPINHNIKNGRYFQSDDLDGDASHLKRGDLFIKFNVQIPSLDQFSSIQDIATLSKVLPGKADDQPDKPYAHEQHLSNIPGDQPNGVFNPDEYDYDQIEVDSQDLKEEEQDDLFYLGKWSKEAQNCKKKRRFNEQHQQQQEQPFSKPGRSYDAGNPEVRC